MTVKGLCLYYDVYWHCHPSVGNQIISYHIQYHKPYQTRMLNVMFHYQTGTNGSNGYDPWPDQNVE